MRMTSASFRNPYSVCVRHHNSSTSVMDVVDCTSRTLLALPIMFPSWVAPSHQPSLKVATAGVLTSECNKANGDGGNDAAGYRDEGADEYKQ